MSVKVFTTQTLNHLISEARQSPRMRQHLNIHRNYDDPCQRLFNAIGTRSYIRPHRHALDPKVEDLFAIRGVFGLVIFDDAGKPADVVRFGTERFGAHVTPGVELPAGAWHTVIALTDDAVLLELKAGPFDPNAAKEFAPWSPEEGTAEALAYLGRLHGLVGEWGAQAPSERRPV